MFITTDVLVLGAVGLLLLLCALAIQVRVERRLRATLTKIQTSGKPVVIDESAPDPGPHEFHPVDQAVRWKLGIGVYPCRVPGCRDHEPLCHAGRK